MLSLVQSVADSRSPNRDEANDLLSIKKVNKFKNEIIFAFKTVSDRFKQNPRR